MIPSTVKIAEMIKNTRWNRPLHRNPDPKKVLLRKVFGRKKPKIIEIVLNREADGYVISFPEYDYIASNSYYTQRYGTEKRMCRAKETVIIPLIRDLIDSRVWELITNKDFVMASTNYNARRGLKTKAPLERSNELRRFIKDRIAKRDSKK